jgi:hypothetical protein
MITNTAQTRNDAYLKILDTLPKKRQLVYQMINEKQPCTPQQICEKYYFKFNEIAPRFTELRESGYIIEAGKQTNSRSKHKNTSYKISTESERIDFINKKFVELRDKKDKLINDRILGLSGLTLGLIEKEINKINIQIKNLDNGL